MLPLALLVLAAQVGGNAPAPAAPSGPLLPQCLGVRVTAPDRAVPPKGMTFSSRTTPDLLLRPRFPRNVPGDHVMQLKVLTPGGFLYQVITVPFAGAAAGTRAQASPAPRTRVVPGYPRPLEVQPLVPARSSTMRAEYELHARLPVAGTSITLSSLYGTWSVQPFLDGRAEPCGPATRFEIRD